MYVTAVHPALLLPPNPLLHSRGDCRPVLQCARQAQLTFRVLLLTLPPNSRAAISPRPLQAHHALQSQRLTLSPCALAGMVHVVTTGACCRLPQMHGSRSHASIASFCLSSQITAAPLPQPFAGQVCLVGSWRRSSPC